MCLGIPGEIVEIRESEAESAGTVPLAMLLAEFTQTGLQFA